MAASSSSKGDGGRGGPLRAKPNSFFNRIGSGKPLSQSCQNLEHLMEFEVLELMDGMTADSTRSKLPYTSIEDEQGTSRITSIMTQSHPTVMMAPEKLVQNTVNSNDSFFRRQQQQQQPHPPAAHTASGPAADKKKGVDENKKPERQGSK